MASPGRAVARMEVAIAVMPDENTTAAAPPARRRSMRYFFQREAPRGRTEHADRNDDHHHGEGDEDEYRRHPETLQQVADGQARQRRGHPAPRIDEDDRAGADAGREKVAL